MVVLLLVVWVWWGGVAFWVVRDCELREWRGQDVAFVCEGVDPIRVWPWPPLFPYPEDLTGVDEV